jgi:hypothetical protein
LGAWNSVGQNDLKKDSRFSIPVVPERRRHANDMRPQGTGRLGDSRKKLWLLCESLREVHQLIITHLAAVCRNPVGDNKGSPWRILEVLPEGRLPLGRITPQGADLEARRTPAFRSEKSGNAPNVHALPEVGRGTAGGTVRPPGQN